MTKADPKILTLSEFSAFLGVHYLTARRYCNEGLLSDFGAYRLPSGYWRIPLCGAEKFKASLIPKQPKQNSAKQDSPKQKNVKRPARKR